MIKNVEQLMEEVENMPREQFEEMMKSKLTVTMRLTELMKIATLLGTYLETPEGFITNIVSDNGLKELSDRIDSKVVIRLGTYGIELEEE